MLYLQNSDMTSALDSLGANWSHICLSRTLNHGALWHIDFLRLRNILTYLLTFFSCAIWVIDSVAIYKYSDFIIWKVMCTSVVVIICSGEAMVPISWCEMQCPVSFSKEYRKVARAQPRHCEQLKQSWYQWHRCYRYYKCVQHLGVFSCRKKTLTPANNQWMALSQQISQKLQLQLQTSAQAMCHHLDARCQI